MTKQYVGLLVADADNTLWDTDGVFAAAQLRLLESVERHTGRKAARRDRLEFVRELDQQLALRHDRQLQYPPRYLAIAVTRRLATNESAQQVAIAVLAAAAADANAIAAETVFLAQIREAPDLRPGVHLGIRDLRRLGLQLAVATESSRERCLGILQHHKLTSLFARVYCGQKSESFYRQIASDLGWAGDALRLTVGDQLDRDIAFSQEAGYKGVLIPGPFQPHWLAASQARPDHQLGRFDELPALVRQLVSRGPTAASPG